MIARLFAAAFALLAALSAAHAQNVTCFTAPSGDDTNKCASTEFVQHAVSGGGSVPVAPNVFLGGPLSGPAAPPTFRGLSVVDLNSGTNASALTFWRGDGTWAQANQRTVLTTATTFYVNFNAAPANCNGQTCGAGSDSTGDGSLAKPWKTRSYAYSALFKNYDLNGQTVTIQLADATITDSFQIYGETLLGQNGPGGLIFQGNCTSPRNVLIQPAAGQGYTYGFFFGPSATIQCQEMDQTSQRSIYPGGADMVSVGQDSKVIFGSNLWFGCNFFGYNAVTVAFHGYVQFDNDFTNNVGRCQVTTTGSWSNASNTITLASGANIVLGMSLGVTLPTGIPADAYVATISGSGPNATVSMGCIITSPCQTSASAGTGTPVTLSGGGQFFLNLGNGANAYFNTNGQSDYSILDTLGNYPFYLDYIYVNGDAAANVQALTVVNGGQAHGGCQVNIRASTLDTGLMGVPYFPCLSSKILTKTVTLSAGDNSFTVSDPTGISVGQFVNGYATPNGTWVAGSANITLNSTSNLGVGTYIQGPGLLTGAGAYISSLSGTIITLPPCGGGPRCVNNYATYLSETSQPLIVTGYGVPNGTIVKSIVGNKVTMSNPATISGSQQLAFAGSGWTSEQGEAGVQAPVMAGDTGSGGQRGLVPAPAAGDAAAGKFLKADGTWATATSAGQAFTANNDTNVTAVLSGSPTTALVNPMTFTLGWTGTLGLARGGTNASLTASNGGVVWSDASKLNILSGTATANLPLLSGSTATPAWASIQYPASATSGGIPYFSSSSVMASSGVLGAGQVVLGGGAGAAPTTSANVSASGGALTLGQAGSAAGSITLAGSTSGTGTIKVPAAAGAGTNFQLPGNNGTALQVLQTDGSGNTSWASHSAPMVFQCGGNSVPANTTSYIGAYISSSSDYLVAWVAPYNGTLKNLYAAGTNVAGAGQTVTFTVRTGAYNGTMNNSTLTCNYGGASGNTCNDTTHSVSVTAGQVIDISIALSATANTQYCSASIEYDRP